MAGLFYTFRRCSTLILAGASCLMVPVSAGAHEFTAALEQMAHDHIAHIASDPDIVRAVKEQNLQTALLGDAEIEALDQTWRAEVDAVDQPFISEVMGKPGSTLLFNYQEQAEGLFTEMFVTDARGLNVVQSTMTSDYWQGDEDKWQQSFGQGPGAIHISDIEYDDSSQVFQSQVSIPVVDSITNEAIGAITVGVDLWYLE
ncbi:hypothetical protein GCM10007989_21800 [Devosia pacifica]|uniref:Methyl-accepting chemotaxis protein n=1 Tax=Devosia pacifica TaxID=1335967 RepID=A0A918S5W2_9HYPH|nr:hypothetical protein [Devosia pacifica]GHA25742.1 hypothetical protein GCM10007989_21800 [Devosia pacifica]